MSGGHTQLMRVDGVGRYELLGETIDDAAGEAFDKSAKLMGLRLSRAARGWRGWPSRAMPTAFKLPRPLLHSGDLDFSFAGLKTAVLTQARKLGDDLRSAQGRPGGLDAGGHRRGAAQEIAGGAGRRPACKRLVVAGGVGANRSCASSSTRPAPARGVRVHYPELHLCTDNGAMIAMAAAMRLQAGVQQPTRRYAFDVKPRWPLASLSAEAPAASRLARSAGSGSTSSILRHSRDHCGQSWPPSVVKTWPAGSASASSWWLDAKRSARPKPR